MKVLQQRRPLLWKTTVWKTDRNASRAEENFGASAFTGYQQLQPTDLIAGHYPVHKFIYNENFVMLATELAGSIA